jgi:signal transduction histidine kinase
LSRVIDTICKANHFSIDLIIEDKYIRLNIKDDGIGKRHHSKTELSGGFDLLGIRDKVSAFSGNIKIITEGVFEIVIEIPINKISIGM